MVRVEKISKTMKRIIEIIVVVVLIGIAFVWGRRKGEQKPERLRIDTVIFRDTIRDTLLVPQKIYLTRIDTVYMQLPNDTVKVPVLVPIERKVYSTPDYRAVISGFRPNLDSMEVFPKTKVVTQTIETVKPAKRKWIQFGIGIGAGYDPFKQSLHPTIQAGIYVPLF